MTDIACDHSFLSRRCHIQRGQSSQVETQDRIARKKIQLANCVTSMVAAILLPSLNREPIMVNTQGLNGDGRMSRHLDNLKRLWSKLQLRYGNDDALVLEVKREIETLEARGANGSVPYRNFIRAHSGKSVRSEMSAHLAR